MSKKIQNQINQIKKTIVNQNLSNNSIATYNKLGEIEHSLYRYNQLSNAGLKDEAKTEKTRISNLINNFNATEKGTLFKGEISNTRYVWTAEDGACDDCFELDGTEYESPYDAPIPLHPNCKCSTEEIFDKESDEKDNDNDDDEPCDVAEKVDEMFCEVDTEETELESGNSEAESLIDTINEILIQPICQGLTNAANAVLEEFAEAKHAYDIFVEKKAEMEQYKGYDKYYHAKANCQATELGTIGELTAHILSAAKEAKDILKKTIMQGQDVVDVWNDSLNDIGADVYGIEQGHRCRYCDFTEQEVEDVFKGRVEKRNIFK